MVQEIILKGRYRSARAIGSHVLHDLVISEALS